MNEDRYEESDLETLFKVRIPESRIKLVRDLLILFIFISGLTLGFVCLGAVQYFFICSVRDPNVTVMQCIRGDYVWKHK